MTKFGQGIRSKGMPSYVYYHYGVLVDDNVHRSEVLNIFLLKKEKVNFGLKNDV